MAGERHGRGMLCVNRPLEAILKLLTHFAKDHESSKGVSGEHPNGQILSEDLYYFLMPFPKLKSCSAELVGERS